MDKICEETVKYQKLQKLYEKFCELTKHLNRDLITEWEMPFPRHNVLRPDTPREVMAIAKEVDDIFMRLNCKHRYRNFMTDPEEIKAFDEHVEWALKQPIE